MSALLGSVLIFLVPGTYYDEVSLVGVVRGGLIFAGLFFVLTLYPIISAALILVLAAFQFRRVMLSLASGTFLLAYTAWWALMARGGLPFSFWITWLVMGIITFLLALWLLPKN